MNSNEKQNKEVKSNFEEINCEESKVNEQSAETDDTYKFGWSSYSEITNGRFAMLGFLAIILIELFSQKSFLSWAGIF
tara:strand:+ start:358 stop:591 length:234 start_codon:yes stop_codon:yes gene_type:complete